LTSCGPVGAATDVPAVNGRETSGAIKVPAGRCSKENTVAAPATARMIAATTIKQSMRMTLGAGAT
jgi:hypothetical protein